MQDNDMREKLEKIISAYEELQAKMSDPSVLADQKAYNHLAKEYANQGPLAAKAREYLACCSDIDDAKEMLADPDMKEFAQETIAEAESKMPALEEDIKFMLIPSDPADEKDIIVEIRAAAGGDEAAIFAGDLFKMYERFCSSQKWKIELMDVSPSEAGGYKEIQFKVKGDKVYSVMKYESGVHRAPVDSASTPPTPPCASRTCRLVLSCSLRTRSRSCRTRSRPWLSFVRASTRRCSPSSRPPKVPSASHRSARATAPRRSAPTTFPRTA